MFPNRPSMSSAFSSIFASSISRYQYGLLVVLILLGISMGIWHEILTPTLPNLRAKLKVSYASVGYGMAICGVGNVVALPLASMTYDSFPHLVRYIMGIQCILAGVVTIIVPWCTSFWVAVLLLFIQSGCESSINNGGQLTILHTFQDRSIGKMQIYHLGYGIGGVLAGMVSSQFLDRAVTNDFKLTKYCARIRESTAFQGISIAVNITTYPQEPTRRFEYIFAIAGTFAICSGFIFLAYAFLPNPDHGGKKEKTNETCLQKLNLKYIAEGKILFGSLMIISLFLYYLFYVIGLSTFLPYVAVYAIDPCKDHVMSQQVAAYLYTVMNSFFLLGRVLSSLFMDYFPIIFMIGVNVCNVFFTLILVVLSHKYALALWIGACGMRLCNSIVFPAGTSFMNRYIVVTSSLISLAFFGSALGVFLGGSFGGFLVDNYPSHFITYSCSLGMVLLLIIIIFIVIMGQKNGVRIFSKDTSHSDKLDKD